MKIFFSVLILVIFTVLRLTAADEAASVMAHKISGRIASPLALFWTNIVAGSNIVLEPLVDGKLKIHSTNSGGSSFITSIDPFYFEVLAGQLNLTNANLIDWAKMSTNDFASQTDLNAASNLLRTDISNLQMATNGLNTRVGDIESMTNSFLTTNKSGFPSANGVLTSLLQSSNPPVIKTISAGNNIAITDETTNLAIAVTGTVPTATTSAFVTQSPLTNAVTNLNIISANTAFTSLLSDTNQTKVKTISAGSNVTVTDNTTNLVIASSNPGGTVTSIGLVAPSIFGVTNSPITSSGNIGFTNVYQTANTVYAGPSSGAVAEPAFRALVFADLPALQLTNSIGITVDGGGSVLTTGQKGYIRMPYTGTLRRATVMADQNGSAVFDVWRSDTYPPTVANTITASAKPTITSTNWSQDTTLSGWGLSVTNGQFIGWNLDSASTVTRITLQLDISH